MPDHSHDLKPLMVAVTVFMAWKPRVGFMTRFNAPWCASMMLFRYFDVRRPLSFDSWPSRENDLAEIVEVASQPVHSVTNNSATFPHRS